MLTSPFYQAFSLTHAQTLHELRLRNIYLPGPEGWIDTAEELGKFLRLDFVALASLIDGSVDGEPHMKGGKTTITVCRFMQWVPKGDLRLANDGDNMSLAWHINNFPLSPRLADFINMGKDFRVETR